MQRTRLDAELVRRGMARSRAQAARMIAEARVTVGGRPVTKAATAVDGTSALALAGDGGDDGWASRGAHKLSGALDAVPVAVTGRRCLDAGASTGGFTDVLLRRGADRVLAVDVGSGQLIPRLRTDARVAVCDRTNVRELDPARVGAGLGGPAEIVVADLSFISLRLVLPALTRCAAAGADLLPMVKPQFEVGRGRLGAGGVVRDPARRADAVVAVADAARSLGWGLAAVTASPLPGPSGNVEYFVHLRTDAPDDPVRARDLIDAAVADGPR